jgi:tRNA A37 threonylcarbamoyladenosine dehydratase
MDNRFHRTELLLGNNAVEVLKRSHVAVFGLGGVVRIPQKYWFVPALAS